MKEIFENNAIAHPEDTLLLDVHQLLHVLIHSYCYDVHSLRFTEYSERIKAQLNSISAFDLTKYEHYSTFEDICGIMNDYVHDCLHGLIEYFEINPALHLSLQIGGLEHERYKK